MEKLYGKYLIIEFESSSNELDCKILKYKNYTINSEELYIDYKEYNITRRIENNKAYIYVYQYSNNKFIFEYIIVSIFYKKESHSTNRNDLLPYNIKYNTYSYINRLFTFSNNKNNFTDKYPEVITTSSPVISVVKIKIIFLGFAKYKYFKQQKIITFFLFFLYFARLRLAFTIKMISIFVYIKYRVGLRNMEEEEKKQVKCQFIDSLYENQIMYNCSLETNGVEIVNIRFDNNFYFEEEDVEIIGNTPLVFKYINVLPKLSKYRK